MKPLGRNLNFFSLLKKAPEFISMAYNSLLIFKNPARLWVAYIKGIKPPGNMYKLRNGMKIFLSGNDHDSITVMVIFCRKEYGDISKGSKIVDIGANIGVFTLYAAWCGALKIISVEPNRESFSLLERNIKENDLDGIIEPYNFAIAATDDQEIFIPIASSPYNESVAEVGQSSDFQKVKTISIPTLFDHSGINSIDVLKMDCEGAEYPVIYNLEKRFYDRLSQLRMEHHRGSEKEKMMKHLSSFGLNLVHEKHMILWFKKT